jgi:hypothetical protein
LASFPSFCSGQNLNHASIPANQGLVVVRRGQQVVHSLHTINYFRVFAYSNTWRVFSTNQKRKILIIQHLLEKCNCYLCTQYVGLGTTSFKIGKKHILDFLLAFRYFFPFCTTLIKGHQSKVA